LVRMALNDIKLKGVKIGVRSYDSFISFTSGVTSIICE